MPDSLVPVFVIPSSLTFHVADPTSHKQVLTLYNPYDYAVRFQVLCSARDKNKYSVVDPEGSIQSHCCIDIVVRHNAVNNHNIGQTDKFRIQMYQYPSNKLIGKKDVKAELVLGEPERQTPDRELFQQIPAPSGVQSQAQYTLPRRQGRPGAPNGVVVTVAILCATTLLMPSHGEESAFLPEYLKPSTNLKLVVSYVLGLITVILLRPT